MAESNAVLDASAVLAVLNGEAGADVVLPFLARGLISSVNYAETVAKLIDLGAVPEHARSAVSALGIGVADFNRQLADRTAELRPLTRHRGLSLGDRACIALGEREAAPIVTMDRNWRGILPGLDIRVGR
ncbi:MAG: type II toxin-antitoxin system VapC family toxin [Pseudorhodoplanes sp.]|uniref:type II toxin-antitoxin system VapC family toxin n=1 Tax=Pseudorhodoplanes sp. TaxID=1934341 RepID=UPI003D11174E